MGLEGGFSRGLEGGLEKGLQGGLEKGGLPNSRRGLQAPSQAPLRRGGVSGGLQGDLTRENLRRKLEAPSQNK